MISFDEFLKQDDEEKYKNMQQDNFEIQILKNDLKNRDNYISKLEVAYSKHLERLNNIINGLERYINEEYIYDELGMKIFDASTLQDKLQELKGSDKE